MKNKTIFLFLLLFVLTPAAALAKEGSDDHSGDDHGRFEVRINQNQIGNRIEVENEVEVEQQKRVRFEVKDNKFEIRGEITSIGDNSFVIGSQTIRISPATTGKFEQKGNLAVGAFAKVEGVIINNIFFATEIKTEAQGRFGTPPARFKFKVDGVNHHVPGSTISATPSAFPIASSSARVEIKARGPVDQVIKFIESILASLKNLV